MRKSILEGVFRSSITYSKIQFRYKNLKQNSEYVLGRVAAQVKLKLKTTVNLGNQSELPNYFLLNNEARLAKDAQATQEKLNAQV